MSPETFEFIRNVMFEIMTKPNPEKLNPNAINDFIKNNI